MTAQVESPTLVRVRFLHGILCCPITKAPLRLVGVDELLSNLAESERGRVSVGTVGAFISDVAGRAYPFSERIVSFLDRDALRTQAASAEIGWAGGPKSGDDEVKQSVQDWYDGFGWRKNQRGVYNDTAAFSQSSPDGHGLYELMSHLWILDRLRGGDFILDAASGAIAHPEYLAFSWFYKSRVCVDMSITALQEADAKLGAGDFCCLADVCKLPFRNETFDGVVSAYTVQHIPESQQAAAVKELYRVLRPAAHLCILTEVRPSRGHDRFLFLLRVLTKTLKLLRLFRRAQAPPTSPAPRTGRPQVPLYFVPQSLYWWRDLASGLAGSYSIESLRVLKKVEFEWLFGSSNLAAKILHLLQGLFPRLTARVSFFCLIDLAKPTQDRS
jgi:SAM-dependent methyltransferase/uncharacterized protein YbaR (Trm112 family)